MHTGITIFGMIIGLVGLLIGLSGAVNIMLLAVGYADAYRLQYALGNIVAGFVVACIGALLCSGGLKRASHLGKRLRVLGFTVPAGTFLFLVGLSVIGVLLPAQYDPIGLFDGVTTPHLIGYPLAFAGAGMAYYGIFSFGKPRETKGTIGVD